MAKPKKKLVSLDLICKLFLEDLWICILEETIKAVPANTIVVSLKTI